MSFPMSKEDAKKYAMEADMQIDGLDPANTSPVQNGGSSAGMASLSGPTNFQKARTRISTGPGNQSTNRREFPSEGVSKK